MAHELVIDIETAPVTPFSELSYDQQHYLINRGRDYGSKESPDTSLNLTPLYGKIIVIGMWLVTENKGCVLLEGPENRWVDELDIADTNFVGEEDAMLQTFWKILAKYPGKVITWNGRAFDIPFLYMRSLIHGIQPTRNILGSRYSQEVHCDLYEVAGFFGATRITNYSLEAYCHAFGVNNPKSDMSGKEVAEFYRDGAIEEIAEYCMGDVSATLQLYHCLQPLLKMLSGERVTRE